MARPTVGCVTTQPPPPRYRVVEEGRRLVVIDTVSGAPVGRSVADAPGAGRPAKLLPAPERTDFGGRSTLVTHPVYDDRGPRTLALDEGATRTVALAKMVGLGAAMAFVVGIVFAPWLIVLPILLVNPKTRAAVRAPVTRWLDRFDSRRGG